MSHALILQQRFRQGDQQTSALVSAAIVDKLQPLAARVKTLTFDNGKEFAGHAYIDEQLQSTA